MRWLTGKGRNGAWEGFYAHQDCCQNGSFNDPPGHIGALDYVPAPIITLKWAHFLRFRCLLWSSSGAVLFLPHVVVVGFSNAPSCDENSGTACAGQNRKQKCYNGAAFTFHTTVQRLLDAEKARKEDILTPADQDVCPEVLPLREERDGQEGVKIKTFHQQPEEAGHDTVLEEHNHHFAANL